MINFPLKYPKNNVFLGYFLFLSRKNAVFCDFLCFLFCTLCHSSQKKIFCQNITRACFKNYMTN